MTEQLWAFEIERMGMLIGKLDPHIDSLLSAVGKTVERFRSAPNPLTAWTSHFDMLMEWTEAQQIECAFSYELIGHGPSRHGENVAHIRLLLVMEEKAATVFRLFHPETKPEPYRHHWKEKRRVK